MTKTPKKGLMVRREALNRLSERWGKDRLETKENRKENVDPTESIAWQFLEVENDDPDSPPIPLTASHLRSVADELRAMRAEKFDILLEPREKPAGPGKAVSKRNELLSEIASEHFLGGMHTWLTGMDPEHGISSTPVEEMEHLRRELAYRIRLSKEILIMMEREIASLTEQIKAKRMSDSTKTGN